MSAEARTGDATTWVEVLFQQIIEDRAKPAEKIRLARMLIDDVVEEDLDGVLEPALCVGEGMMQAASMALETTEQFLADHKLKAKRR